MGKVLHYIPGEYHIVTKHAIGYFCEGHEDSYEKVGLLHLPNDESIAQVACGEHSVFILSQSQKLFVTYSFPTYVEVKKHPDIQKITNIYASSNHLFILDRFGLYDYNPTTAVMSRVTMDISFAPRLKISCTMESIFSY
jgi:hypothetical protein